MDVLSQRKMETSIVYLNYFAKTQMRGSTMHVSFDKYIKFDEHYVALIDEIKGSFQLSLMPKKQSFPRLTEIIEDGKNNDHFKKQMIKVRDFIFLNCVVKFDVNGQMYKVRDRSDIICFKVSTRNYKSLLTQLTSLKRKNKLSYRHDYSKV